MNTDFKSLQKLAKACRAAGIKHYKCLEFEFTLTEDGPVSNYKKRTTKSNSSIEEVESAFKSEDQLTEEQLLLWSTSPEPDESTQ